MDKLNEKINKRLEKLVVMAQVQINDPDGIVNRETLLYLLEEEMYFLKELKKASKN